jgi:hypothetical protein
MRLLSASPWLYKGAPLVVLALGAFLALASGQHREPRGLLLVVVLLGAGAVAMRYAAPDLADTVYDAGDHLIVSIGRDEERIFFANIDSVAETHSSAPTRITLVLRNPGRFGREVVFIPAGFIREMGSRTSVYRDLARRVQTPPDRL